MTLARAAGMSKASRSLLAALMLVVAACGGSGQTPTAPAPASGGPLAAPPGGATIGGTVHSGAASSLTGASAGAAMPGLLVSVAGTSISSGLDAAGRFALAGVPPGDVQLQFSGPVAATLPVTQVQPSETISMVLTVTSSSVAVDSQVRSAGGEEQVEGRVEALPPAVPVGTLRVAGRTIETDSNTAIRDPEAGRSFSDLEIGQRVHVKGRTSGDSMLASSILIQNVIVTIPVNVNGEIEDLSGTAAAFEFEIGSTLVRGDSSTEFFGDGDAPDSFSSLDDGVRVEVRGRQRNGFVYAERIHVNGDDDDDDDDEQDESASIHGRLTAMNGTAPDLTLTVGGTTVRTNGDTEVKRRGDFQTLAALRTGQDLHVVGTRQSNGSLVARKIEINDDAPGGAFEIEGSLGGLQGTCPAISFKVNGYSIRTSGATAFQGTPCTGLKSGDKVEVKGTSQAGSVVADTIRKK
jgi:hypothetical protein